MSLTLKNTEKINILKRAHLYTIRTTHIYITINNATLNTHDEGSK